MRLKAIGIVLAVLLTDMLTLAFVFDPVKADPSVWTKKRPITISGSSSDLTDYQVYIIVDYDSDMQSDYDDLRFKTNGYSLSYWIESYTVSTAKVWVKVPSMPTSGTTIYMYYGNPSASSASNGTATFEFFDGFSGSSLDSERWPTQGGSITVSGGEVHFDFPGTNLAYAGSSSQDYTGVIEFRAKYTYDDNIARFGSFIGCGHYGGTYLGRGIHIWHAGAYTLSSNDPGVYHKYKIVKTSSDAKWYFDDVYKFTRPISGNIGTMNLGCQEFDREGDCWYDYVLIRKYSSPEPTATVGDEIPVIHDVTVTNVTPSKTVVGQGYSMSINVTVENQGDFPETFNVTTYYNGTIPNGDFEMDPTGTSFNDITDWNYSIIVHKGNPPTGDNLVIVDDYYFSGSKSLYSYLKTTSVSPWPGDSIVSQYLSTEEPVFTAADYISLWIGGDGYTTSSRYAWYIQLILTDGTNTHLETLRGDCWGLGEGLPPGSPDHFDYYNATETGADGRTWKRYTRRIPDNLDKSNLTVTVRHFQYSWDLTTASSWYRLDNIYFSNSEGNPRAEIETKTVTNLPYGEETTITFTWNTTGVAKGNYTITAYAKPVPGETDTTDNTFTDGWVIVAIVGDITGPDGWPDGKCDIRDIALVAKHFGQNVPPAPPNCDITGPTTGVPDGKIDIRDIATAAKQFGKVDP